MTHVEPRFEHLCPISFGKFSTTIERVMNHTFSVVEFDRDTSFLPTYIGVEVMDTDNKDLLRALRGFFEELRTVHQNHFVRFVTDTMWAMESQNGDIFYCHDGDKRDRVDVIWSVRVINKDQFEITITSTPDNRRREILTDLEHHIAKFYVPVPDRPIGLQLYDLIGAFYQNTKNIRSMEFLKENVQIMLMPTSDNSEYVPVMIAGITPQDTMLRWRNVEGQIQYQSYRYPELFTEDKGIGDLIQNVIDEFWENGEHDQTFNPRVHYDCAEMIFSIYDSACKVERSNNDIIIFHMLPDGNINSQRIPVDYLTKVM